MFQDDFVAYKNLRGYLDSMRMPGENPDLPKGYWNLFTFMENDKLLKDLGKIGWGESNQLGRGAVALVFHREAVVQLLTQAHAVRRPMDANRGWRVIDGGIVTAMANTGWREYCHYPTLVQHIGTQSTMGNRPHPDANSWRGENFNALDFLKEAKSI